MDMTKNMGDTDRNIRLVAGVLVVLYGLVAQNWLGLIGVVLLATAYLRFCPAYLLFKINTGAK